MEKLLLDDNRYAYLKKIHALLCYQNSSPFFGENESVSYSVVPNSLQPHGLQPTRLLCPWDFPGEDTGVVCHFLLQGIEPRSPAPQADSLPAELEGSPLLWRGLCMSIS